MNNDVELIPVKGVLPSVQVQSDNVIYVPQAHKNKAGIVKEGDGVLIENGVVSLNKQTVEDMIDANKWVSYGFQQNLTEDEKGMARHNIGAGDNDFTGSYYDVTQKPHLNTDNIDSLDTGDEEINNTINLHKVSKTGSFDDLNDVPTDTLDFAESERQKSKNLFPYETVSGNNSTQKFFNPLPAGTYTLSAIVSSASPDTQCLVEVYYNNTWLAQYFLTKSSIRTSETRTINSQFDELRFYGGKPNYAYDFTFSQVQLEQGSVATDYQPYHGQITHNGDAPVVFAESERQKSKNLLNISDASSYTTNGVTLTIKDNIITLNGTTTGFTTFYRPHQLITANVGNYAFSFKHISGTISGNSGTQSLYNQVGKNEIYYPNTSIINDITEVTDYNQLRIAISGNITFDNFKYSLQYEQGDVATDYQPYNGAIVHEKQIADVEHIEVIYDNSSSDANINWGKTSGIYGGDVVSNKDFTKYKKVIVYSYSSGNILTTIIPLTNILGDAYIGCNAGLSNDTTDIQCIKCSVNSAKTEFKVDAMGYYNTSGFVLRNNTNSYLVFKIEGAY